MAPKPKEQERRELVQEGGGVDALAFWSSMYETDVTPEDAEEADRNLLGVARIVERMRRKRLERQKAS